MKRIVVGIDPGTGKSSPTGFAAFDPDSRTPIHVENITSKAGEYRTRYKEIAARISELLQAIPNDIEVLVACESFVMRGKGGEVLARLTGAIMAAVPEHHEFTFVQNTTVKKVVGGHGQADKDEVANGVADFFGLSAGQLNKLSSDEIDALAIGITAHKTRNCDEIIREVSTPVKKRSIRNRTRSNRAVQRVRQSN